MKPLLNPDALIRQLWKTLHSQPYLRLYVMLNAARDEKIYSKMLSVDDPFCSLYRDDLPPSLADSVPYLVQMQSNSSFSRWLLQEGWGQQWGYFLASAASLQDLQQHFANLVVVQDERGKDAFFQFYDPRIMRNFFKSCHRDELKWVFGPVFRFYIEDEQSDYVNLYSRSADGLVHERVAIELPTAESSSVELRDPSPSYQPDPKSNEPPLPKRIIMYQKVAQYINSLVGRQLFKVGVIGMDDHFEEAEEQLDKVKTVDPLRYEAEKRRMDQRRANELDGLAITSANEGLIDKAIELHEQSAALKRRIGDNRGLVSTLMLLGSLLADEGQNVSQAQAYLEEAKKLCVDQDLPGLDLVEEALAEIEKKK